MIPGATDIKRIAELIRFFHGNAAVDAHMVLKGVKSQIVKEMNELPADTPYYDLKIQLLKDARLFLEEIAEGWM